MPVNEEKITLDVDAILDFETRYAKILVPEDERRDLAALYHKKRLSDVQSLVPGVGTLAPRYIAAFRSTGRSTSSPRLLLSSTITSPPILKLSSSDGSSSSS